MCKYACIRQILCNFFTYRTIEMSEKFENVVLQNIRATDSEFHSESQERRYQNLIETSQVKTTSMNSQDNTSDEMYESMDGDKDNSTKAKSLYQDMPLPALPVRQADYTFVSSNTKVSKKQLTLSKEQLFTAFLGICIFLVVSAIVAGLVLGVINWMRQGNIMEQNIQQSQLSNQGDIDLLTKYNKMEALLLEMQANLTRKNNELAAQLYDTNYTVSLLTKQILSLQSLLGSSTGDIAITVHNLTSRMAVVERDVSSLNNSLVLLKGQTAVIENNIDLSTRRIMDLESNISQLNTSQQIIKMKASNNEYNINTLSITLVSNITEFYGVHSILVSRVGSLEDYVDSINRSLSGNVSALVEVDSMMHSEVLVLNESIQALASTQTSAISNILLLNTSHSILGENLNALTLSQSSLMARATAL